jgi:hypothetical protein
LNCATKSDKKQRADGKLSALYFAKCEIFALRQTLRKKAEETRVSSAFVFINAFCGAKSYLLKTP